MITTKYHSLIKLTVLSFSLLYLLFTSVPAFGKGVAIYDGLDFVGEDNVKDSFDYYSIFDRLTLGEKLFEVYNSELKAYSTCFVYQDIAYGDCAPESEYGTSGSESIMRYKIYVYDYTKRDWSYDIIFTTQDRSSFMYGGGFFINGIGGVKLGTGFADYAHWSYPAPWYMELSIFNIYVRGIYFNPEDSSYLDKTEWEYELGYLINTQKLNVKNMKKSILYLGLENEFEEYKLKGFFYNFYILDLLRFNSFFRMNIYNEEYFDFTHGDIILEADFIFGDEMYWSLIFGVGGSFSNNITIDPVLGGMIHIGMNSPLFGLRTKNAETLSFVGRVKFDFSVGYNYNIMLNKIPLLNHFIYNVSFGFGM